jgi:hypothetical protein
MTSGFRQTFSDWLEQRLSAELYINPQDSGAGSRRCTRGSASNRCT